MRPLAQEQNPEVLRQYALLLEGTVKELTRKLGRIERLQAQANEGWLDLQLRDQLTRLQKKYYGFGRETVRPRRVGHRQQELRLHGKRISDEAEKATKTTTSGSSDSPLVKVHEFSQKALEAESALRGIRDVGERVWRKMKDFYQESTEITVVERIYQKVIHRQAKYRLQEEYNQTGKEVIITAPGPAKLKAGCKYSIDFALSVVSDKYEYHLPLERQRRKMEATGLEIDVKTLYRLCEFVAEHCESVMAPIRQEILEDYCAVHLDETPWRILRSQSSGYLWVMGNRTGSYYRFEPSRSGKVPKEMLKGYHGSVVTDAYGG